MVACIDKIHNNRRIGCFFLLFYGLLLFIPELVIIEAPGVRGYIVTYFFSFFVCFSISWLICCVGFALRFIHKFLFVLWHSLFHTVIFSFVISEVYLVSVFNLQWNAFTFQLLKETTSQEIKGFFESYGLTWQSLFLLLAFVILFIIEIYCIRRIKRKKSDFIIYNRLFGLMTLVTIFIFSIEGHCLTVNPNKNYEKSDKIIKRDVYWNLYQSYLLFQGEKENLEKCILSQADLRIVDCDYCSQNIVVIIGETFNKHHSSLYEYKLKTNPQIEALKPYVFNNVISPANATTIAFQYFLSFRETESSSIKWCDTPLFPAMFKKVGYNVVFYSNQYVAEGSLNYYDASAGFFNHPAIYGKLFNKRNHYRYPYDMGMVEEYKNNRNDLERDSLNLLIFHLHGQHSPAVERYPQDYDKFKYFDIDREDLDSSQKQTIAEYDNAVLYNDVVVAEIVNMFKDKDAIVLYFADHGEEIYDFRDRAGRFSDYTKTGANGLHNQLDIPFLIIPTNSYREKHPTIISSIENSLNKPFMTDFLPHLLIGLAGIHSEWYDSKKDLLSAKYDVNRHRIISGVNIDYDLICNDN